MIHEAHTNLDKLVPSSGNDDWVGRVRGESNLTDPLGVTILGDVELTFTESVPQFDCFVTTSTNNLTIVWTEGDTQHIVGVSDETTGGQSRVQVPKTKGLVP
jgi:hypothetical protein